MVKRKKRAKSKIKRKFSPSNRPQSKSLVSGNFGIYFLIGFGGVALFLSGGGIWGLLGALFLAIGIAAVNK